MSISRCTLRPAGRSTPQMHHGIHIIQCIWQPCWIPEEKVGISCHLWIITVETVQLALYSHVRCNPFHNTPNIPKTPMKYPPHDNYKFQLWGLIFASVICNIVVKANLGTWTPQTNPQTWQMNLLWFMETPKCISDIYYGMYLAAMLDSSRKGGNFFLFLNN